MYKQSYQKCQICVGCGACRPSPARQSLLRVVSDTIQEEMESFPAGAAIRLVTVDIGTTTLAARLYAPDGVCEDTYAVVNPQVRYGADVLSRILAARDKAVAAHLKNLVRAELQKAVERFRALLADGEEMVFVLAANMTMVYLFMGWDPSELGEAPFQASHMQAFWTEVTTYGIPCFVMPSLSAFVGGDIAAGIYACGLLEREETTLLLDLGTNGEIVLGNRNGAYACATAAGPAFEGGPNRGIWGADMIRLTAALLERGILDRTGLLEDRYFEKGVTIGGVRITQESVRALQCAKAAIAAGIRILTGQEQGAYGQIDRVVLAGGFGYFLRLQDACRIGLLPRELEGCAFAGGNTALAGAYRAGIQILRQGKLARELPVLFDRQKVTVLNLAQQETFADTYVGCMEYTEW